MPGKVRALYLRGLKNCMKISIATHALQGVLSHLLYSQTEINKFSCCSRLTSGKE